MSAPAVLFLGGNGHAPVRLEKARAALREAGEPFELVEVPYCDADDYDGLLVDLAQRCTVAAAGHDRVLVYATGIGGLVALSLRARGALADEKVVLQGAVLWGLERRWFPRVMRLPGMPHLLAKAFTVERIRKRFVARHLLHEPEREWLERFFAGYADAGAFAAWFRWLTPGLLRQLERELPARPGALDGVEAWWGERDTVVGVEELRATEDALGVGIPVRTFADWGHYPMMDDPQGWVREVGRVVETAGALS